MPKSDFDRVAGSLERHFDKIICQQLQGKAMSESWIKNSSNSLLAVGLAAICLKPPVCSESDEFDVYNAISELLAEFLKRRVQREALRSKLGDVVDWSDISNASNDGDCDDHSDLVEKLVSVCDEHDTDNTLRTMTEHVFKCIPVCSSLEIDERGPGCSDDDDDDDDDGKSRSDESESDFDSGMEGEGGEEGESDSGDGDDSGSEEEDSGDVESGDEDESESGEDEEDEEDASSPPKKRIKLNESISSDDDEEDSNALLDAARKV